LASREIQVPDLGDFKNVAIIDVLVKPGDRVEVDTPLLTLETEKATMDVPSPVAGVIERLLVQKGGLVSAGTAVAVLTVADTAGAAPPAPAASVPTAAPAVPAAPAPAAAQAPAASAGTSPVPLRWRRDVANPRRARRRACQPGTPLCAELGVDLSRRAGAAGQKGRILWTVEPMSRPCWQLARPRGGRAAVRASCCRTSPVRCH
jgi:pyruvate dehydrogenase E2 component (dihydrolipoamide acetyltransferase)